MPKKTATPPKTTRRTTKPAFVQASAGRYTYYDDNTGKVSNNMADLTRLSAARKIAKQQKMASLFDDGALGPMNSADSNNIGYYSYQFPVDAMEQPASRAEELEFFHLAYNRDPIVARAIDLHTELPLSKMKLEKPKCSVESFSDYVYDYFQRLVNDTRMFAEIINATREYQLVGEAFMFVEQPQKFGDLVLCPAAFKALKKGRGFMSGVSPMSEAANAPKGGEREILPDFIESRRKQSSLDAKRKIQASEIEFAEAGIDWSPEEDPDDVHRIIVRRKAHLASLKKEQELETRAVKLAAAQLVAEAKAKIASTMKTAEPGDAPAPAPAGGDTAPAAPPMGEAPGGGEIPGLEGADGEGAPGEGGDLGGGFDPGLGGGGGGGGFGGGDPSIPGEMEGAANGAIAVAEDAKRAREINDLQRYIHLLERKKQLLEQLQDIVEQRRIEKEIFSHVVNDDFEGFDKIQLLQPERITIAVDPQTAQPEITYKPSDEEKESYLNDTEVSADIKDRLEAEGVIPLNQNPYAGSYVVHFARKKSGYEMHGRSALQSPMRSIIYREKLRQVQTTLASRNMTPKTLITAPGASEIQVAQLRAHADESKSDPDYTIVTNYEVIWNEIDSQGRLLNLSDEWQHTNANLAIGLGFSPEILIGEGLYGNNRIQLDMMSVSYTQFREALSDVIENQIFKPIAIIKGFYEADDYGRPRWIYPKVTFGTLALRDSSDLFDMAFNLYSKGSLPVSAIYEIMGYDAETMKRELEDDLFTVKDSKFNELLGSIYSALGGAMTEKTNVLKRIADTLQLEETEPEDAGLEGSGEGF
jgi:hypothetical protein